MLSVLRGSRRALSLAAVSAAAALAIAAPAYADPVTGKFGGSQEGTKSSVKLVGRDHKPSTSLLKLDVGDKVLLTYCIELNTNVDPKSNYSESGWGDTTLGANAKHVNWILHHSVPYLTPAQLAEEAGLGAAPGLPDAVAGTQAAIWHYSDGAKLDAAGNNATVVAIYNYLTGDKNTGMENEPAPTLSLSPDTVSGEPGDLLGPIKVTTNAKVADVAVTGAPEGAKLLGPDKKTEVSKARDGDKLWLSVPEGAADGSAKVTADASAKVSPGRVFKGDRKTQTLILADSDEVAVHAEATASWAHVPSAAPGSKSEQVCKPDAGVKITISNTGDADAEFTISYGDTTETETVAGGESKWKVIPVKEDSAYTITVKSGEYEKVHKGLLNCLQDTTPPSSPPAPGGGGGLPETGMNNLTTILGVGGGLLAAGLALLFVVRQRRRPGADQA